MSIMTILIFFIIAIFIIASIVAVICLIVKESGKNNNLYVNNQTVQNDKRFNSHDINNNDSTNRISDTDIDYLKKLKDLQDNGVLSEEEYNIERDKIIK